MTIEAKTTSDYTAALPTIEQIEADYHFFTSYRKLEIEKALQTTNDLEARHFLREELTIIAQVEKRS